MKNIKKRQQYWKEKKAGIFLCGWKKWLLIAVGLLSMTKLLYAMDFGGFEVEVGVGSQEDFVFEENSKDEGEHVIQPEIEVVPEPEVPELEPEPDVVESEPMKPETKPAESETKPAESETKPVELEAEPMKPETKPVEPETKPMESESNQKPVESNQETAGTKQESVELKQESAITKQEPAESESELLESESEPKEMEMESEQPKAKSVKSDSKKQSKTVTKKKAKELKQEEGEQEEKEGQKKTDEKEEEQMPEMLWECLRWKKNVGKEKEIILNIDTEGAVSILSFRIDGEECEWEWKEKQIFCTWKKDSGEGILEILFLYERGKNFRVYDASVY